MNKLIETYLEKGIILKNIDRTGWNQVNVPHENVENVMAHIGGVNYLKFLLKQYKVVDFAKYDEAKIDTMIMLNESTKITVGESSVVNAYLSKEDKEKVLNSVFGEFENFSELMDVYNEFVARETNDAKLAHMLLKTEENLQALKYAKDGLFTREAALNDFANFSDAVKESISEFDNTVGGWVGYNKSVMDSTLEPELYAINEEIRVSK